MYFLWNMIPGGKKSTENDMIKTIIYKVKSNPIHHVIDDQDDYVFKTVEDARSWLVSRFKSPKEVEKLIRIREIIIENLTLMSIRE